jgi:hypothetical protein
MHLGVYSTTPLVMPLQPKVTPFIRPDFRCTEISEELLITYLPLKRSRDHLSYKTTISLQNGVTLLEGDCCNAHPLIVLLMIDHLQISDFDSKII